MQDIEKLIKAAKDYRITDEILGDFELRLKLGEERFVREAAAKAIDNEWLNRDYVV